MASGEAVIRRFYELSKAGDPSCWELWAADVVGTLPPDFPETEEWRGVDGIRRSFARWQTVFGDRWWEGLELDAVIELPNGRLIADVTFDLPGQRSGAPFQKQAAVIYTVRNGKIVRAEHFMDRSVAREVAGR
jgi:ketosteroid isomerase-like protein